MIDKFKKISFVIVVWATLLLSISSISAFASESELPTVGRDIELTEDNPVVEITEHGIVITKSCDEAIEKKLYMAKVNDSSCILLDKPTIDLVSTTNITPAEFQQIEYVQDVIVYHIGPPTGRHYIDPIIEPTEPVYTYFQDDDPDAYYHEAIDWAKRTSIAKGYDGNIFGVGETCSRREFLIFLWRMEGRPESEDYANNFNDMKVYDKNSDTYRAISWAVSNGIVKGYKDGGFHPNDPIKRVEALIMMYRVKRPRNVYPAKFSDVTYSEDSDSYRAIAWAQGYGITKGYSDGTFRPQDECLREQCITFLYRWEKRRSDV